ncbi:MAG: CCA tRNA nucleotidyltransferase [Oligoflexales bacterium]
MTEKEHKQGLEILSILEQQGFEARFAGGCVRDFYLGIAPLDYDIATTATPDQIFDVFHKKENYRALPTGIEHGTVTIVFDRKAFEVTSLREDVQTDGRHAKVVFGKNFEKDAARRDFTMNAMYQDRHGNIFDFHQGRRDLDQRKIRFVGDCAVRVQEDYLRILRYFRFQARLSLLGDEETLSTIQLHAAGLQCVSRERISQEIKGFFQVEDLKNIFIDMKNTKVLNAVFPNAMWEHVDMEKVNCSLRKLNGFIERLCFLCIEIPGLSPQDLFHSLKLTKKNLKKLEVCSYGFQEMLRDLSDDQARILFLWDTLEKKAGPGVGVLVFHILRYTAQTQNQLSWIDKSLQIENIWSYKRKKTLPLSGADISETLNIYGKELGDLLFYLRQQFYADSWRNADEGLDFAKKWVARLKKSQN